MRLQPAPGQDCVEHDAQLQLPAFGGLRDLRLQLIGLLQQRAAFQQLINPNAGLAVKTPGSFEPVTALDPPRSAMALKRSSADASVLGGKNSKEKVVGRALRRSEMCMGTRFFGAIGAGQQEDQDDAQGESVKYIRSSA